LELLFDAGEARANQACAFAQFPENMDAYYQIAQQVYKASAVTVGMAGEEAHWKLWPEVKTQQAAPIVNTNERPKPRAEESLNGVTFHDEETEGSAVTPGPEDLFLSASADGTPTGPEALDLSASAAQLSAQLDSAARPVAPPTIAEAIEIFEAIILPDED
jgi:hypothetical protein